MRRSLPLLSLLLLPVVSQAQTTPSKSTPLEKPAQARSLVQQLLREGKIMSPRDAKRGMTGYALSVFQGTKIERFSIEVLGVLEKVQGGGDLVLIKVTSGPVVERQSGIIQGMSGSPVYINGKLLGAIAIGFGFPKEPIGGVTPITEMIETALPDTKSKLVPTKVTPPNVMSPKVIVPKVASSEMFRPRTPLRIDNRRIARVEVTRDRSLSDFDGPAESTTLRMRPATQMLLLSGISEQSLGRWKKMLEPYGMTPVLGGGAMGSAGMRQVFGTPSKKTGVVANLAPGAAIGVQIASGDVDATGVGTVTYRLGNRLLAFGHPMFGLGAVSMPMTTAYVHDIFPAYDISFKLASPIESVGELEQDTNFAIGGTVGKRAETVPMRITLVDAAKKINHRFNTRLIKDPTFTPQMAQQIATEALQATFGLDSDKTVKISFTMGLKNGPAIRRVNTVYAADQVIAGALGEMMDALSITQANPYEKGAITSIDLRAEVVPGRKTARIRRIYADKNRVKAGEKVQISVVMEPTGLPDDTFTEHFTLNVPADAPSGALRIAAGPASDYFSSRARVGGAPPRPGNFKELLQAYSQIGPDNQLVLQVSTTRRFLLVDRKKVSNPPPTWNRLVPAGQSSSIGTFNETEEQHRNLDWDISGLESISIPVESNRDTDRQRPDAPTADDSSTSTVIASSDTSSSSDSSSDASSSGFITPSDDGDAGDSSDTYVSSSPGIPTFAEIDDSPNFAPRGALWMRALNLQIPSPKPTPPATGQAAPKRAKTPVTVQPSAAVTPVPTATPIPTPTADPSANGIARPLGHWTQRTGADFGRGHFDGTLVSDNGTIRVGPKNERIVSSSEPVAWSVAATDNGTVYLGTGHSGRLLKVENGVASVFYEGPEVAVSSLALDSAGNLYAGVSPGGRVYRFHPDGSHETILQTGQTFVHALAFDGAGNLLVATGGEKAEIYRIASPSTATTASSLAPLATLPQKHARSISFSGDNIYVGTGDEAVLYRIGTDGHVTALYQATGSIAASGAPSVDSTGPTTTTIVISGPGGSQNPDTATLLSSPGLLPGGVGGGAGNEILGVATRGESVYFGTSNSGSIYRWTAATGVQEFIKTPGHAVYALKLIGDSLWAGTGEGGEVWRVDNLDGDPSAARVLDATQPQILALASAAGHVYAATGNNAAVYDIGGNGGNTFTSNVFDAGQVVRFGALRAISQGANFEFRSGNTLEPDTTWSPWQAVVNGDPIAAPPARYAQYRAKLADSGSASRVDVAFRTSNRTPHVAWTTPAGGEYISGKKSFSWTGTDPDKDPLHYKLELRGADKEPQAVTLTTTTASSQEIDTKKYADGVYTAQITGSDATRNPEDPRTDSATSLPFTIDNTAPTLGTVLVAKTGSVWTAHFDGNDALSPLAGAEWRVAAGTGKDAKAGDWQAAGAVDGIFDSKNEAIVAHLDPALASTSFKTGDTIEFRLRDAAGNMATAKVILTDAAEGNMVVQTPEGPSRVDFKIPTNPPGSGAKTHFVVGSTPP